MKLIKPTKWFNISSFTFDSKSKRYYADYYHNLLINDDIDLSLYKVENLENT